MFSNYIFNMLLVHFQYSLKIDLEQMIEEKDIVKFEVILDNIS